MFPIARREAHIARPQGADLVVLAPDHRVHRLDATAAWIWQHADGQRDVDSLLLGLRAEVDANADRDLVFEALDRLSDAGLLDERVAPPTGFSRRVALQRLVGAGAVAALTAVLGAPRLVEAAQGGLCGEDKAIIEEIAWLEAEQSAVADILDDWVTEGENADDISEIYLDRLMAREQQRKRLAADYAVKLDDATEDLAQCKLDATTGKAIEAREQHTKHHHKVQQEKAAKTTAKRTERSAKRVKHAYQQEADRKGKARTQEASYKKKQQDAEKIGVSKEHLSKREAHSEMRMKAKVRRQESSTKQAHEHLRKRQERIELQSEDSQKSIKTLLLRSEERAKIQSEAFASKQSEEASKQAGVSDQVYALAQQDALVAQEEAKKIEAAQEEKLKSAEKAKEQAYKLDQKAKEKAYKAK